MYRRRKNDPEIEQYITWHKQRSDWEVVFGQKHVGEFLHDVVKRDPDYIVFCLEQDFLPEFVREEFENALIDVNIHTIR